MTIITEATLSSASPPLPVFRYWPFHSPTENLLYALQRRRNMIAAQLRFRAVRIAERNTRPALLVVKDEPIEQPAFEQMAYWPTA